MTPIAAMSVAVPVLLVFLAFGLRFLFDYRLTERGLYVVLLRLIPIRLVPLGKIAGVERGPFDRNFWRWGVFTNVRLGNRLLGEIVRIRTRGLPMTGIVITPEDPDAFEQELKRVLERRDRSGSA